MSGQNMKSVLIAGCSAHGISTVLAQELIKRNHFVIIAVPDTSSVSKDISALPAVQVIALDPKSPTSVSKAAEAVTSATEERGIHGLDVLINDVGVGNSVALLDIMMDSARDEYDSKVEEALGVGVAFADLLGRRGGRIVNMSSAGVFIAAPYTATHFSTKGALMGLSDRVRHELSFWDISVTSVMLDTTPSATDSTSRVVFPPKSIYASIKDLVTRWIPGTSRSDEGTTGSLVNWVLEDNTKTTQMWMSKFFRGTDNDNVSELEKGLLIARPVAA